MIRTSDAGTGSASTDLFTPGVYGFALTGGTATLTDAAGTADNMTAGTNRYGYSNDTIGATGLLLDTSKTSVNTNVYMGRGIMQTLSKYIDDVLMLNGDIDQKIFNLEDDVDSLVEEQEALDLQIAGQQPFMSKNSPRWKLRCQASKRPASFLII